MRFCVDYRRLNAVTRKHSYPIPRMDDCMDSLGQATIFTTLDANWGCWKIGVRVEYKANTAFCSYDKLYQCTRMPFGLTNAPAPFQRALNDILARHKWKTCLVYIDDVIVFSSLIDEHIDHVDVVLVTLRRAGIHLRLASVTSSQRRSNTWVTSSDQVRWKLMNQRQNFSSRCTHPKR